MHSIPRGIPPVRSSCVCAGIEKRRKAGDKRVYSKDNAFSLGLDETILCGVCFGSSGESYELSLL